MRAIVIAAGSCVRLRPLTSQLPKCMLEVKGLPLIEHLFSAFSEFNIEDVSVIRGYLKEKINYPGINYFDNTDYQNNNILHSLMYARQNLEEAAAKGETVIVTYSDIFFEKLVLKKLLEAEGEVVAVVDSLWREQYIGRTNHPVSEAENVILDDLGQLLKVGKHVITDSTDENKQGEFIGLWKMTPAGINQFLETFDRVDKKLNPLDPFQLAKEWRKAYITDIFQEMIDCGIKINAAKIEKNWAEFDTVQDFLRMGGTVPEGVQIEQ